MTQKPKPTRGMPRSLLFAMIPAGFLLIVLILIVMGVWTQETTVQPGMSPEPQVESPAPAAPAEAPAPVTPTE